MAFYLKPPRGCIPLTKLREATLLRLRFLCTLATRPRTLESFKMLLEEPWLAESCDVLIEGSACDRASHFTLVLASLNDPGFRSFVLEQERRLFEHRLSCLSTQEVQKAVRGLHRQLTQVLKTGGDALLNTRGSALQSILDVVLIVLKFGVARHWHKEEGVQRISCLAIIEVPFTLVTPLVAKREVELCRGTAHVPCRLLPALLTCLFNQLAENIQERFSETSGFGESFQDSRLRGLFSDLLEYYQKKLPRNILTNDGPILAAGDVDAAAEKFFPPCARRWQQMLRAKHHLPHEWRFQYSLFLKEVGMPLSEAMCFWEKAYSLVKEDLQGQNSQRNLWTSRRRKYEYSIRHIYGLEGGHKNYCAHSCTSLQTCGSCSFATSDTYDLQKMLEKDFGVGIHSMSEILRLTKEERPLEACQKWVNLWKRSCSSASSDIEDLPAKVFFHQKPSQVYFHLF